LDARGTVDAVEPQQHEWVNVRGGRLYTTSSGRGVPVVVCHGGPGSYDYLGAVAELLDGVAEVHRFDQRGGGRSQAGGPWELAALVGDMEVLRRHWRHERWVVAGHSWGAHLALFYALAHPGRTLGVVFLNGTGVRWGWGSERRANRMPRLTPRERAEVERLERELAAGADEPARSRLRDLLWLTDFADRRNAMRSPRFADYPTDASVVSALERDWQRALDGIDEKLSALTVPALVLHGEADPIGERGPRELARLLPQGRFVLLGGVGHVPWLEQADGLRHHLREFVAELADCATARGSNMGR
jgi:proline iminopeptidase